MNRFYKSMTALLLSIVLIISTFLPVVAVDTRAATQPTKYSKEYNSGERGVVCTTLDGTSALSYYTGTYTYDKLDDQTGTTLYNALQTLMRSTHTYTSTYNDCHYKADRTDCENEAGDVLLIYTSYNATMSQWNGWNREHVWPQSLGGGNTTGGGADLHHIRPSDAVINSTRGNKKYGNTNGGTAKYGSNPATGYLGGYYNSTYFEPVDEVKGDVARICLYVYVRWGTAWGAESITEVFQSVDVLLEWCALDPVDTWEMGRNEVVQDIQGNRNVFIDYPELAWLLFNREIPDDMVTPSGEAMNGESGSGSGSGSGDVGGDPACTHTSTEIRNASAATCNREGYTGDTYCKSCGAKVSTGTSIPKTAHGETELRDEKNATCTTNGYTGDSCCTVCGQIVTAGQTVPATGIHSYGDWQLSSDGYTYVRYCSNCGNEEILTVNGVLGESTDAEMILILLILGVGDSLLLGEISK